MSRAFRIYDKIKGPKYIYVVLQFEKGEFVCDMALFLDLHGGFLSVYTPSVLIMDTSVKKPKKYSVRWQLFQKNSSYKARRHQ